MACLRLRPRYRPTLVRGLITPGSSPLSCLPLLAVPMSRLISFVADMTGKRDRDLLEATVADVLFRMLRARRVSMWRVLDHHRGARVRLMAGLSRGQPVAMSDPTVDAEDLPLLADHDGFEACFVSNAPLQLDPEEPGLTRYLFPVSSERDLVGILEVEVQGTMLDTHVELVDGLTRIYRNHLSLLEYSEHDTLTALLNRKTFDDVFLRRVRRQPIADARGRQVELVGRRRDRRPDEHPWLAVIDIDHFKRINDCHGHLFGDEVLLLIARMMRTTFRSQDVLFRFGGEEFVVLLGPSTAAGAETVMERFREQVETFSFPQVEQVTVSIGLTRTEQSDSPSAAFDRADDALYFAKQNGRNQVRTYETLLELGLVKPKEIASGSVELF
ncbi:MAG: diguanylate cyclase [Betaproteobacteria bacterium]|nr:diguanylate cyclase [Betaproteobacteria bacterium]